VCSELSLLHETTQKINEKTTHKTVKSMKSKNLS